MVYSVTVAVVLWISVTLTSLLAALSAARYVQQHTCPEGTIDIGLLRCRDLVPTWTLLGEPVEGMQDQSGWSVALSGTTLVIGAKDYNHDGLVNAGRATVYELSGDNTTWSARATYPGYAAFDQAGESVAIGGSTILVGAPFSNSGSRSNVGQVFGSGTFAIQGATAGDRLGSAVSVSTYGGRVAVAAPMRQGISGARSGQVQVYDVSNSAALGNPIDGTVTNDRSGTGLALSGNGNRVIIGAPDHDSEGFNVGQARVFEFLDDAWIQIGQDILGRSDGDQAGFSVDLSADGNRAVVGIPFAGIGGQASVYEFAQNQWRRLGTNIVGQYLGGQLGFAVAMSDDGSQVIVGEPYHDARRGAARVYKLTADGTLWTQIGGTLAGDSLGDEFGRSVDISDAYIAIGAPFSSGTNGDLSGQVRVYELEYL